MPVDINNLPTAAEDVEVEDYDSYVDAQEFPPPLADGTYTFKSTKVEFDYKAPENGHRGVLTAIATHDAFDDTGNKIGSVSFDRFSDKIFERSGVKVSMMADQLRAWGDLNRYASPQDKATAIKGHVDGGETFKAVTKREAFCNHKDTPQAVATSKEGWSIKGKTIPADAAEVECQVCHKSVRVNSKIDRRLPK